MPDTFSTLLASNGPRHNFTVNGPYLGAGIQVEPDGQPTANATGDGDEEDGVTINVSSNWTAGSTQSIQVTVANAPVGGALLGAWFDWNGDGDFNDAGEYFSFSNLPNGTNTLNVTVGNGFDYSTMNLNARFRIFSSGANAPGGSLGQEDFSGLATNGEVEDYQYTAGSLPVSLASFASRITGSNLRAEWTTASESRNIGFEIFARIDQRWTLLHDEMFISESTDAVTPQSYSERITLPGGVDADAIEGLAIASVDTRGKREFYGLFEPGKSYGEEITLEPIRWKTIRGQTKKLMQTRGFVEKGQGWRKSAGASSVNAQGPIAAQRRVVDFEVIEPGMQRVTYEELAAAGLDLGGLRENAIAVTRGGQPIARVVEPAKGRNGAGGYIAFWGERPELPDALYVQNYIYRIEVAPDKAVDADRFNKRQRDGQAHALFRTHVDEDLAYAMFNASADPWYATRLRYPGANSAYQARLPVGPNLLKVAGGRLEVLVSGVTDFPDAEIDHRVEVKLNGQSLGTQGFGGRVEKALVFDLGSGIAKPGDNLVEVSLPGGVDAPADLVYVDSVTLWYPGANIAESNRLLVEHSVDSGGLTVSGLASDDVVGFAHDTGGGLTMLRADVSRDRLGGTFTAVVPGELPNATPAAYWVSGADALLRPTLVGASDVDDLLEEPADYLVVAHPAFLPASGDDDHPLNAYIERRESQGWRIRTVSIIDIQNAYGGGMPLPGALTAFLSAADGAFDYAHVLLVGGDSYDYLDNLSLGSLSFIPTQYAPYGVTRHAPNDGLLADLDGDRVPDKAVGRWPVRTVDDLRAVVTKTLDWEDPVDGTAFAQTSTWATDTEDPYVPSLAAQAERMIGKLVSPEAGGAYSPWPEDNITRIYFDEVTADPGKSVGDTARARLLDALAEGQTITGFNGHGAEGGWTRQAVLYAAHVKDIANEGKPTLVSPLTCYTSYFVHPSADTLANRLMNGFRVDENGEQIPGAANGAVAVHGAATLSSYEENEQMAGAVLDSQLRDGMMLGEAVRQARASMVGDIGLNWVLLGDPTLRVGPAY